MFSLEGKICLVTGAASGIGAAIAETFARAKAFVYVTDCNERGGHQIVSQIHASGGKAEFLSLDVSSEESCSQLKAKIESEDRAVNILVNNAGVGHVGTMLQTSGADLDRLYAVNVRGVFNVTKTFLPDMLKRKSGNIINLASIGGGVRLPDPGAFFTTKIPPARPHQKKGP